MVSRWAVLVGVFAGPAHAEVSGLPTFVALDRATGQPNLGAQLGLMVFEDSDSDGGPASLEQPRLVLYGEYAISPRLGVVASTSVVWFRSEARSELGLAATYLGGYARHVTGGLEIVGRASIALPTESFIPRDSYFEDVAVHGTLLPWMEERAVDAGAFWLHAGASARYRRSALAVQLDGFFDVPLSGELYADDRSRGAPLRLHLGAGAAYARDAWRAGLELLYSGYPWAEQLLGDLEGDEVSLVVVTGSVAFALQPGRALVAWASNPLDRYIRSRWHAFGIEFQALL